MVDYYSEPPNAPRAVGPYSPAVGADSLVFLSGQVGLDPATGKLVGSGFEEQAEQVLKNLKAVLTYIGLDFSDVVKSTVFLTDLNDFAKFNELYGRHLDPYKPARSTFQVAGLPMGARIEIEMIAMKRR